MNIDARSQMGSSLTNSPGRSNEVNANALYAHSQIGPQFTVYLITRNSLANTEFHSQMGP